MKKSIAIDRAPIGIADEWYLWSAISRKNPHVFRQKRVPRAMSMRRHPRRPGYGRIEKRRQEEEIEGKRSERETGREGGPGREKHRASDGRPGILRLAFKIRNRREAGEALMTLTGPGPRWRNGREVEVRGEGGAHRRRYRPMLRTCPTPLSNNAATSPPAAACPTTTLHRLAFRSHALAHWFERGRA